MSVQIQSARRDEVNVASGDDRNRRVGRKTGSTMEND
jgi:hypothetical protein